MASEESSLPLSSPSSWIFSMELLQNVHILRVFLIPPQHYNEYSVGFSATILPGPPALYCTWKATDGAALRLPLPLLLFDYSASPRVEFHGGHIQLSVRLLAVSSLELQALSLFSEFSDNCKPLKAELIQHTEGATGACSKLEGTQFSSEFFNAESDNGAHPQTHNKNGCFLKDDDGNRSKLERSLWEDDINAAKLDCFVDEDDANAAELKIKSVKFSSKPDGVDIGDRDNNEIFIKTDDDIDGVRTHLHNIVPSEKNSEPAEIYQQDPGHIHSEHYCCRHNKNEDESIFSYGLAFADTCKSQIRCDESTECWSSFSKCQHEMNEEPHENFSSKHQEDESTTTNTENEGLGEKAIYFLCRNCSAEVSKKPTREFMQLPCAGWRDVVENWYGACCCSFGSKAEFLSARFERSLKLRPQKCLMGSSTIYFGIQDLILGMGSTMVIENDGHFSTLDFLALGNGFVVWDNEHSKKSKWLPVHCHGCGTLLGACPYKMATSGWSTEGIHLFKSQVTVNVSDGSDFIKHTKFQELFTNELHLKADHDNVHRFLIRSLNSELPLLQLIVLSYESLMLTGRVTCDSYIENVKTMQFSLDATEDTSSNSLLKTIKVMYLDCSSYSSDDIRATETWVQEHEAETLYMLDEVAELLKKDLVANSLFFPDSCGLSEQFHISFLYI